MKRVFLLLVYAALLTSCATPQMLKPKQPPELSAKPDSALMVIVRNSSYGGGAVFKNYLDGKFIGETIGKTYFITDVLPGEHYIVATAENTGIAHLNFQAGKHYFLYQGTTIGVWGPRTTGFFPMTRAEVEESMEYCTYLKLDTNKKFEDIKPDLYQETIKEYQAGIKEYPEGYKEMLDYEGE